MYRSSIDGIDCVSFAKAPHAIKEVQRNSLPLSASHAMLTSKHCPILMNGGGLLWHRSWTERSVRMAAELHMNARKTLTP